MAVILCAGAIVPASAVAATADAYEPDDWYSAATAITVGDPAQQHTIYPDGDEDWVSFAVTAGVTYTVETGEGSPAESIDTVLYLYDSDGTTQLDYDDDGGEGFYSLISYTADVDKTVYARIKEYHSDVTGAYALSVATPVPEGDSYEPDDSYGAATPVVIDGTAQQHTIDPNGDEDWVSFSVQAGWLYAIETAPGTPVDDVDTVLSLYDSDGATEIAWDDDGNGNGYSLIEYTADADQTVYARVYGWSGTGTYALTVTAVMYVWDAYEPDDSCATATPIATDGTVQQHNILPPTDQDWVSFSVSAGWRYTIETAPGTPAEDTDTILQLYDSDGTTLIAQDNDGGATGYYSRIVYDADAAKTVYARVTAYYMDGNTYALSVTGFDVPRIDVPGSVDLGNVEVGAGQSQTFLVANTGVGALTIGTVTLEGDGFSIVRDEAGGTTIPPGESREVEVQFAPTVARTGPPVAVEHDWTNVVVRYNYSVDTGLLVSFSLYAGFQNVGGAGDLDWHARIGASDWTGTGAVVAGGRYTVEVLVSAGATWSSGLVELLQPVSESWSFETLLGSLLDVTYIRVADAFVTIPSDDPDKPEAVVRLYGVALPAGSDTSPPTTTDDYDDLWHSSAVTVQLSAVDNVGGSGMSGGLAKTEYSTDGGATWIEGDEVTYAVRKKRGGGSGVHTLLYRSTDAAGNIEETKSVDVKIDARAPLTTDDAPPTSVSGPVTVHLTAEDSMFGVSACSGVAATWYALDGGGWTQGSSVSVSGVGTHWLRYYSVDAAGNAEYPHWRAVTIAAGRVARLPVRVAVPR